jgi:hypothetical protein
LPSETLLGPAGLRRLEDIAMPANNSGAEPVGRHLRVEAGAAAWQEFDEAQQQAYTRIATMVAEAVRDLPPIDQPVRASEVIRRTRSAFVVGGRGTGKTTVLDTFRRDSRADTPLKASFAEPDRRQELLRQIRGRVVWLETLDMEPLPPETNLLASILVRLEEAAKGFGGGAASSPRPRGLVEPGSDYHSALLELQRLQTQVALAWDGNLQARQGSLDPDAFALEVARVEKARLSLNARFADTLQKLAAHVFRSRDVDDVLFVLPVDDFDLNPPVCLDLLRVLRLISIPRLFTIVLGDMSVASTVLSLKLSNDLGSIVRRGSFQMLAVMPSTVASIVGDVAANAIRKLLPPGQRIELSPMRLPESMNFRPLGARDADPYLHELFAACPVYTGWALPAVPMVAASPLEQTTSSLRQFLLAPPLVTSGGSTKRDLTRSRQVATESQSDSPAQRTLRPEDAKAAVYSGARFIQAPPRLVADTWIELHKINAAEGIAPGRQERDTYEALLNYFAGACRAALRETPTFTPDERDYLDRAVSRSVAGSWTLRALPLSCRTETAARRPVELPSPQRRLPPRAASPRKGPQARTTSSWTVPGVCIHLAESLGWQMEVYSSGGNRPPGVPPPGLESAWEDRRPDRGSPWEERRPGRLLSESAVTALIMYHDLLAFPPPPARPLATSLLTSANAELHWAMTEWRVVPSVRFAWPAPPSTTFFDYDRFRAAWNAIIHDQDIIGSTDPETVVERLAFAWLSVGTAVVEKALPSFPKDWDGPMPWADLTSRLDGLASSIGSESTDASRDAEWLKRVAELLMPEMGLPDRVIRPFTVRSPGPLRKLWNDHRASIRQRRIEKLKALYDIDSDLAEYLRPAPLEEFTPQPHELAGPFAERQPSLQP